MNDTSKPSPSRRQPMQYLVWHLDVMRENLRRIDGALPLAPQPLSPQSLSPQPLSDRAALGAATAATIESHSPDIAPRQASGAAQTSA